MSLRDIWAAKWKALGVLLLIAGSAGVATALIKYNNTVREKLGITPDTASVNSGNRNGTSPAANGDQVDNTEPQSRRSGDGTKPLDEDNDNDVLTDYRTLEDDEILRREHLLVNGQLPDNWQQFIVLKPLQSELVTEGACNIAYEYRLDLMVAAGVNVDVVLTKRVGYIYTDYTPNVTLSAGESYFLRGMDATLHTEENATNPPVRLSLDVGKQEDTPTMRGRTGLTFHTLRRPQN